MATELTNFLPEERQRALSGDYYARLGVVVAFLLGILVIIHGILLIPAYLYLSDRADAERARLSELSSDAGGGGANFAARTKAIERDSARLLATASSTPGSDLIASILEVPRPGISLVGFSYDASPARLVLTGVASSRDALRSYDAALAALPYVDNADLPLSAFTKETDIGFTIILTGSLTP